MPVGQFWALTLYSENTRRPYDNGGTEIRSANLDSEMKDLKYNADGSIDLYIGARAQTGFESNFMKTVGDANLRPRDTARLCSHDHRYQPGLALLANTQGSLAILVSPLEYLVRIYPMLTSYSRNRRAWDKRGFYDPTLLLRCPSQPLPGIARWLNCNRIAHTVNGGLDKVTCRYGETRLSITHKLSTEKEPELDVS